MKFIDKFAYRHPRYGVKNLMTHVSILTAIVFVMQVVFRSGVVNYLYLDRALVFRGQLWRLVTFLFIPETYSLLWIFFTLYFYYFLGSALEATWGSCRFSLYYTVCALATIIAALCFGGSYTGFYVNLSIFLAFAYLYPNQEFLLFFILPVKVKYLALVDVALLLWNFVGGILSGNFSISISILASLAGLLLFFGGDIWRRCRAYIRRKKFQKQFRS